jgi:cytidylate kinase
MSSTTPVIAIDGPSASGKGTVAARVAAVLGWHCLDSGSLYRLVALAAIRAEVALETEEAVARIARTLAASFVDGKVLLAGAEVGDEIRTEEISAGASKVAAIPAVRTALLARQREMSRAPGLVAEGRDMGTVVFPGAALKVFLTASAEARAERRYKQLIGKGLSANMATLLRDIHERDARDTQRAAAPLRQAADAVALDTTQLTVEQAVAEVLRLWNFRSRS